MSDRALPMTLAGLVNQSYPSPEWAVFFEVSNATGSRAHRRADAVALGVWPSRGHTIVGFEFKEDRRDWLREKRDPAKADVITAQCDQWFVVAGRSDIVLANELPAPWGLLVANATRSRLVSVKPCQPFTDRDRAVMPRAFVAAMLRKITETMVPRVELQRLVNEALGIALERSREGREAERLRQELAKKQAAIDTFKEVTGLELDGWRGPRQIATAVQAVLDVGNDYRALQRAKTQLEVAAKDIGEALAAWPAAGRGLP